VTKSQPSKSHHPEDGGSMIFWNAGIAPQPRSSRLKSQCKDRNN